MKNKRVQSILSFFNIDVRIFLDLIVS